MKKVKLMIVRPTMGKGGADRVTLNLLCHLPQEEYEMVLLLMRAEGDFITDVPSHVRIINANSKNLFAFYGPLSRIIKAENPTIVFSTCGGANMPLGICAMMHPFRSWKAVLSERNILFPPGKNKVKRLLMLATKFITYRQVDVLTAVSRGVKDDMRKKLGLTREIMVVHNPIVDEAMLAQSTEKPDHVWFSSKRDVPVILHVGRFVHQKDHATLLHAFARIKKEKMKARLFLLGDGPLHARMKILADELGVSDAVTFHGFDKNPFKYMAHADIFVLSSLHEGMPGVLIQAMACGVPCISTDCPSGPNELIVSGETGILVPVADVNEMTEAMMSFLTQPELRKRVGASGKRAVDQYHVTPAVESYQKALMYATD